MTEQTSPNLILTLKKDKVKFDGEYAIVDTGLNVEEFIISILKYESSPREAMAVMKEGEGMTDPTNTLPTPNQSGTLKPCPFCGRNIHIKCQAKLTRPWWDIYWIHEGMEDRRAAFQRGENVDYCVIESVHIMISGENEDSVRREAIRFWNRRVEE